MKKEIDEVRIKPDGEGGHHVTIHHKPLEREGKHGIQTTYMEPESKDFGSSEGHEMLAHVANHLEINEPEAGEGESEEVDQKEDKEYTK